MALNHQIEVRTLAREPHLTFVEEDTVKSRREKGYWHKRKEVLPSGPQAQQRAGRLREHTGVAHVTVDKEAGGYAVRYSVAAWYEQELERSGVRL
jgi:hypothetical protein